MSLVMRVVRPPLVPLLCPVSCDHSRAGAGHWALSVNCVSRESAETQWAGPAADSQHSGPGRGNNTGEGQMGGGKWKQWCLVCILVLGRISIGFPECFANFLRSLIQDVAWTWSVVIEVEIWKLLIHWQWCDIIVHSVKTVVGLNVNSIHLHFMMIAVILCFLGKVPDVRVGWA